MIEPDGSIVCCSPLNTYGGMSLKSIDFAAIRLGCWLNNLCHLGIEVIRFTYGMHGIRALECALLSELNKVNGPPLFLSGIQPLTLKFIHEYHYVES